MKFFQKKSLLLVSLAVAIASAANVHAAGIDDLKNAIEFTDVIAAIFAVGVLIIGVDLAQLGYRKVRAQITRS